MKKEELRVDIVIIGAGVVGCAISRELAMQYPDKIILVLEKLKSEGLETSSKNSGVLHSGIHQNPKFLKSKLVLEGNKLAHEYVKNKNIPVLDSGMLIALSAKDIISSLYMELISLFRLAINAKKEKIFIKFLTYRSIKKLCPNIKAIGAIYIPSVWVVDALEFTKSLKKDAENNNVEFLFNNSVKGIVVTKKEYIIETSTRRIRSEVVINSAGLYADDIAKMAGFNQYKIYPWRGEYYEVIGEKSKLVKRLIYPAVPRHSPSKGIQFSPRPNGKLFIGPNARLVPTKNYYTEDKTSVEVFLKHAKKYLPQITKNDLRWAYSGIRPKITRNAKESDFIINMDSLSPVFINLIGIESPGLSASMAIAKHVSMMMH